MDARSPISETVERGIVSWGSNESLRAVKASPTMVGNAGGCLGLYVDDCDSPVEYGSGAKGSCTMSGEEVTAPELDCSWRDISAAVPSDQF